MDSENETVSADEMRRRMKERFDAANTKASGGRQTRRDAADAVVVTQADKRWPGQQKPADDAGDMGENDSSGG